MRILGIDPGLRITGYGAIESIAGRARLLEAGILTPDTKAPLERRLAQLHTELRDVIISVQPDVMVVEELWSSYKNPSTAVLMGHARGVLCLAAAQAGVGVRHLAHAHVKRSIAGSGAANKNQVNRMVMTLLRLSVTPEPEDVSDALALALAYDRIESVEMNLARAAAR